MSLRTAVVSQKGGVGKTTVCLNLATALAERGLRTLLVDLDPQGAIGFSLARQDAEWPGITDVLMGRAELEQVLVETKLRGLTLLPRGRLAAADVCEFERALHRPGVLEGQLQRVGAGFDRMILDTPAGLGLITRAALTIVDFALLPFQAEPLALRSIGQVLALLEQVREHENPKLELLGILPMMVDLANEDTLAVVSEIWDGFGGVLDTAIPRSELFLRASHRGVPIGFLAGPRSAEARRFELLADETESIVNRLKGKGTGDAERPERRLV